MTREVRDELNGTIIIGDLVASEHFILEIGLVVSVSIYRGLNASIDTLPR
jgi:hypothetical protein